MREISAARFYELMVITSPEGTPEELAGVVDQISGYVETAGGTVLRANYDSPWGRRRLSYPIRHESQDVRDGFYALVHLEIQPDKVTTIERDLKLNERLMRYLVLLLEGEPVFPEPEVEGEDGETPAVSPEGAVPGATAADASTTVDEPTAKPEEPPASEATAEDRRTLATAAELEPVDDAPEVESESVEEIAVVQSAPVEATAEVESETTEDTAEGASETAAEITEMPADADGDSPEEKE